MISKKKREQFHHFIWNELYLFFVKKIIGKYKQVLTIYFMNLNSITYDLKWEGKSVRKREKYLYEYFLNETDFQILNRFVLFVWFFQSIFYQRGRMEEMGNSWFWSIRTSVHPFTMTSFRLCTAVYVYILYSKTFMCHIMTHRCK